MPRTRVTVSLLLLLLAPQGLAAEAPTLQFSTPAQVGGILEAHNPSWALIVLSSGMNAIFGLDNASSLALREYERVLTGEFRVQNNSFGGWVEEVGSTDSQPLPEQMHMEAQPEGPVSFYIEADRLLASLEGTVAAIEVPPGTCVDFLLAGDDDAGHGARPDALCPGAWPAIVARPATGSPLRFKLEGQQANRVQWHNMATDCPGEPDCPPGGSQQTETVRISSTDYVRTRRHVFEEAIGPASATVTGWGEAKLVVFGGTNIDLALEGWMRLPLASGDAGCASCLAPSNQTFSATGNLTLSNLQIGPDGGLQGDVSGDLSSARFDETAIDPALVTGTTAVTVAAATAAGLIVLKFLLAPLFTRLSREQALEHPRRRAVFEHIQRNPGTSFRETARVVGIAAGTVRHHLNVLQRAGMIVERPHGATMRFFENHGKHDADWVEVVMLREPPLKLLFDWLKQNPQSPQTAILEAMEVHGWSRSTTQHRLSRLVDAGLVTIRLQGRYKIYNIADRPPPSQGGRPNPMAAPAHSPS